MRWEKYKLSDLCKSISDGDHQPPPKTNDGIPFVTISNITSTNQLDFSNTMFVPQEYYDALDEKRKAQIGDILYSVVGSFGIPVYMKEKRQFVFQRHIAILRPDCKKIVPQFLFYAVLTNDFYMKADAVALGAAQRTVSLTSLRNMEIEIPSIIIQEKIVSFLKVYDDLIENNQKQIKLLEEAVQRLYKEWFVDLRFQGYENVDTTGHIPDGWHESALEEIAVFKRGKTITRTQVVDGNVPVVAGGLTPAYYHNKANTHAPVITVSGSGANAGYPKLYTIDVFASDCSFADKTTTPYIYFVYTFLKANKKALDLLQKGSAQPHVYAKDINSLKLIIPPDEILTKFTALVTPFIKKIEVLEKQINKATKARDCLLPRLMSGEMEVPL